MKILKLVLVTLCIVIVGSIAYKIVDRFYYSGELIGIKGTFTYHRSNCTFIKKSNVKDLIFFKDLDNTESLGYRPCKTCYPPDNHTNMEAYQEKISQESEQKRIDQEKQAQKLKKKCLIIYTVSKTAYIMEYLLGLKMPRVCLIKYLLD